MDALSEPRENNLTRRANQRHYFIITPFVKTPMALPNNGRFGAMAGKKSLPTIEVAPARHSEGSPLASPNRARFRCVPEEIST
jgi:hypothetical protein